MNRARDRWVKAAVIAVFLVTGTHIGWAQEGPPSTDDLPLPEPRPFEDAPQAEDAAGTQGQAGTEVPAVPQPGPSFDLAEATACEASLRQQGVRFELLDPIEEGGGCGTRRPLRVTGVADGIIISGNVRLRCQTAQALHQWVDQVVAPSAQTHLGTGLTEVQISTSYQCRRRNNAANGKLSEHAFANGIDVMTFMFEDHPPVPVTARPDSDEAERAFQAAARGGACAYFTTVLGPGTDEAHGGHFHLDLAERSGGYRICQ